MLAPAPWRIRWCKPIGTEAQVTDWAVGLEASYDPSDATDAAGATDAPDGAREVRDGGSRYSTEMGLQRHASDSAILQNPLWRPRLARGMQFGDPYIADRGAWSGTNQLGVAA